MKSKEYLENTIKIIGGDRADDYGDKLINHQNIAGLWSAFLGYEVTAHDVAICMMLVKVARLKHNHTKDCYIDMAGYAAIAGEIEDRTEDEGTKKGRETAEYIKSLQRKKK